ncbi:MAG: SDR family oxidoreductase [Chitinophagaceae bacterium]|nr:SDR family oxidoreductase [Chitinophagaceae bacterium]
MKENQFSLKGKVIVVTGATGILGHAFIKSLAAAGAIVGVLGRNEQKANERVKEITDDGGEAIALLADVQNEQQLIACRDTVLKKYGRIDGLVNGAGGNVPEGVLQAGQDIFSINVEGMKKALDINVWGTLIPTLVFGKAIAESGGGSIVNISSVSADRPLTKVLGYTMGKAAIEKFSKWFAIELASRYGDTIRMNAIVPGFFLTEQNKMLLTDGQGNLTERGHLIISNTPFKKFGKPEDLGGALVWLMSDASSFVTGTTVTIDGGFTAFSGV